MHSQMIDRAERQLATRRAPAATGRHARQTKLPASLFLLLLSAAAIGLALYVRAAQPAPSPWVARLWLGAIASLLGACWLRDRTAQAIQPLGLGWATSDTLLILAAVGAGMALRVVAIGAAPSTMLGDEGRMATAAREVLGGQLRDPFATGWLSHPTLWFFLQAQSMRVFGDSLAGARMLSALLGSATVATTYVLARLLYGRPVAAIAALLLATYHLHIHFSRLALNNIGDPLFGTLIMLCLACGLRTRRWLMYGLAGVTLGLALYFYHGARVFYLLLGLLAMSSLVLQRRRWRSPEERRHVLALLLVLGAGALVAAAPLLQTFAWDPRAFTARFEAAGVTGAWLSKQAQERGTTPLAVLLEQLGRAALAFHVYPDAYGFFDHRQPLLWGAGKLLMPLGLLIALARGRRWAYQVPLAWLLLTVVCGGMMFRYTPGSPRFLTLAPVLALLSAFALHGTYRLLLRLRAPAALVRWASGVALAALCLASPALYFGDYLRHERLGGPVTHRANALGRYLSGQPAGFLLRIDDETELKADLPLLLFLAPQISSRNSSAPLKSRSDAPQGSSSQRTIYVLAADQLDDLASLERRYPGGERQALSWLDHEGPLLYVYAVDIKGGPAPASCHYLPRGVRGSSLDC